MFCYNCGCHLSKHDYCTSCGADVGVYKKIMAISNLAYNEGLEKAKVRDLSGAVSSLRQSLKFNKGNIEARNLLGLVYFEMGEVVAALSEWVISKNMRPEKNIADDYINMLQNNGSRLETINSTIKKYNQALVYCMNDSKDLAVIQLKKVLSMNGKFIRAHLLLALLYIDAEEWEKAKREVTRVLDVDKNNTQALSYQLEIERMLVPDENSKVPVKKAKKDEPVRYTNDNELIIQPTTIREPKNTGVSSFVNIVIGIVIGVAATYFLMVPSAESKIRSEVQAELTTVAEQSDAKSATIQELENQIKNLQEENDKVNASLYNLEGEGGAIDDYNALMVIVSNYIMTGDIETTAAQLDELSERRDLDTMSAQYADLYRATMAAIGPNLAQGYYDAGKAAYNNEDWPTAIENLENAAKYEANNADAWYYLGSALMKNGNNTEAIEALTKVLELVPGTERAARAQKYIDQMQG